MRLMCNTEPGYNRIQFRTRMCYRAKIEKLREGIIAFTINIGLLLQYIGFIHKNLQKPYSVRDRGSPNPSLTYPIRPKPIPRNEGG